MSDVDDIVAEIAGEDYEFWKQAGKETLTNAAAELLAHGVPRDQVASILGRIWYAACEEYGA